MPEPKTPINQTLTPEESTLSDLTPMQIRFAREYALDHSSIKGAAIRAGYSIHSALDAGNKLARDPRVLKLVKEVDKQVVKDMALTKERVLQELCLIAFANLKDYLTIDKDGNTNIDLEGLNRDNAAPLVEISIDNITNGKTKIKKVRVKQADKMAALDKLGKHLGLFAEKIEVTGKLSLLDLITQSMKSAITEASSSETNETTH